ncbi:MAG: carboxymuconolactone decarboxylase family protein, partial [Caldimonas sp.]
MARLSYFDVTSVPGPLGEVLRTRPALNLYRILPHAPQAALGFLALGRALLTQTSVDPALREVAILRVGALCDASYEVHQHRRVARGAGLNDAQIDAVLDLSSTEGLDARQRLVVEFTDAVVRDVKAPAQLNERVAAEFGDQGWLELLMTIGYYLLVSRVLENVEVDIE